MFGSLCMVFHLFRFELGRAKRSGCGFDRFCFVSKIFKARIPGQEGVCIFWL